MRDRLMSLWNAFRSRPAPTRPESLKIAITVIVEPDGDELHAYCPAFKGLHVGGRTDQEVTDNLREALVLRLASLAHHGDPLPVGPDLSVVPEEPLQIPAGAWLRHVELQWPSPVASGTR